jgi:uncharacterized membrane protein YqjE
MTEGSPPGEGIVALARRLVRGLIDLAKLEVTRGLQEIGLSLGEVKAAAIRFGIAVALVALALVALVVFFIQGLAALTGWPDWLAALLVFVALAVLAVLFGVLGYRRVRRISPPEETMAAVKEDVEWAKRLLRRG